MKSIKVTMLLAALGLSLIATSSLAQVLSPARLTPLDLMPQMIPNGSVSPSVSQHQTNVTAVANRRAPGQNVKDLVKDFRTARQEFLESQQELLRQLKIATDEQRAVIRE